MPALITEPDARLISYLYWLTDEQISSAQPFTGWHDDYTSHPSWGIEDAERNAWHCRYFGLLMKESGLWVGPPAVLGLSGQHKLRDGNHRVRACQWLFRCYRITINIPIETRP